MVSWLNSLKVELTLHISEAMRGLSQELKGIKPEGKKNIEIDNEDNNDEFVCPFFESSEDVFKLSEEERYKLMMEKLKPSMIPTPLFVDFDCMCNDRSK